MHTLTCEFIVRSFLHITHVEQASSQTVDETIRYINEPPLSTSPRSEYLTSIVAPLDPDKFMKQHHPITVKEFTESLFETNLDSNDVDGILRLSKSAHISRVLESGPYRGLRQDESAIQVTNALFEKYDSFLLRQQLGETPSSPSRATTASAEGLEYNLQKLGYDTTGVKETIAIGCDRLTKSRRTYSEMLETSSLECRRSDLTTESSMRLYCSMFDDQQTSLSQVEISYILGKKGTPGSDAGDGSLSSRPQNPEDATQHLPAKTSHDQGGSIVSEISSLLDGDHGQSQFPSLSSSHVKPGFEQINEDLYARKDNKFLVLNSAGVESWSGSQPVTKLGGLTQDFFVD